MLDEDEKFFKQNGIPLFSSHMIDLVGFPSSLRAD
jgi:fructose-bisphosphate aldolase class II